MTKEQVETHYVNESGQYLGMFVGFVLKQGATVVESHIPTPSYPNAVEVPTAPPDGTYLWDGANWQAPE